MSGDVLARIFEPFYTTKDESKGTGLGLATSYGIVDQAGGFITVVSAPGQGTQFDIHLPRTDAAEQWTPSADSVAGPGRGSETVLLAEDEDAVRELMAATLQAQGYTVLVARSGEQAVAIAAQHQGTIDMLLTDMVMPGMNGLTAAERIAATRPALKVMVVSGYMPDGALTTGTDGAPVAHVAKPVSPIALARRVRALLDEAARDT
jgi:CheY-like chemotaxis protein